VFTLFVFCRTSFYCLGLLSRTNRGREVLAQHYWEFSPLNGVAVAVPSDPGMLFQVRASVCVVASYSPQ
jgi:hypothetical protein